MKCFNFQSMKCMFGMKATVRHLSTSKTVCAVPQPHVKKLADSINQDVLSVKSGVNAAATARVELNDKRHLSPELNRYRVVPKQESFYMTNPMHEEHVRQLNDLLQKYINVPIDEHAVRPKWVSRNEYAIMAGGTRLKDSHYTQFIKLANRLAKIDSQLMPDAVANALAKFTAAKDSSEFQRKYSKVDENGIARALGRRKNSAAQVFIARSTEEYSGQVLVNGRSLDSYFPRLQDREVIFYPLSVTATEMSFNIFATVRGGGPTGQSGAIANALAKAIVIQNPLLRTKLTRAKCLQPDRRIVERKKPGKPKARKAYTWVKR